MAAALRGAAVVGAALAVMAWLPAVGAASQEVIESPGPLSDIYVDSDTACQVLASGDAFASFYLGTEPGGCGTFLALKPGEGPEENVLWGPTPSAGIFSEEKQNFEPVEQTFKGNGTVSEPYVVTTAVDADVLEDSGPVTVAEVTETDKYVTGQESYEITITVKDLDAEVPTLEGMLYHVGDCYLADHDEGYGAVNVPAPGSVACTVTPNDTPAGRFMAFTPVATPGFSVGSASHVESIWPSFWEDITAAGAPLPNTVEATTNEDNGMGLSWPIKLKSTGGGEEATLKLITTISAYGAPTSSSSAGSCVPSGQLPVTVSAPNGAEAVKYVVDGGSVESVATNTAGEATIALSPGQHTLEYWGEDKALVQESTHHTLSVIVGGAPVVTIASEQGKSSYLGGEAGSVAIAASGLGLTSNPSATKVPISTETPGSFSVTRSATNACGTTSASFDYTVTGRKLSELPPPVLGKTVNVEPVSGEVFVKLPAGYVPPAGYPASLPDPLAAGAPLTMATESLSKGIGFIPLREARQIPVGSELETTRGVARIATATATVGKQQFGDFGAGIFKLLQQRKQKGLTDLDMIDNHPRRLCSTLGKGARAAAKHLSSKVLGRINASGHGHFTVRGQYSAATVRGTVWSVGDRCEGTLTKVTRGVVSVRDFSRRKTITLFTGQSYLARPRHSHR